jgi:Tfp pilus assembly protein PilX
MKGRPSPQSQKGAVIVIALVMLLVFTGLMAGAFTLSGINLAAVGNMQSREEALSAANIAIEQVVSTPFTTLPVAEDINVDINNDNTVDYVVSMATPVCIMARISGDAPKCGVELLGACPSSTYNTVWELRASVVDPASGATAVVRSGVRVLLSETELNAVCP